MKCLKDAHITTKSRIDIEIIGSSLAALPVFEAFHNRT